MVLTLGGCPAAEPGRAFGSSGGGKGGEGTGISHMAMERDFVNALLQVIITLGTLGLAMIAILYPTSLGQRSAPPIRSLALWLSMVAVGATVYVPVGVVALLHLGELTAETAATLLLMLSSVGVSCILGALAALAPSFSRD